MAMLKKYDKVHLIFEEENNAVKKAIKILKDFGVTYELNPKL